MNFCMSVATDQGYLEPKTEGASYQEKKVSLIARPRDIPYNAGFLNEHIER